MSFLKLEVSEPGVDGHLRRTIQGSPILGKKLLPYFASDVARPEVQRIPGSLAKAGVWVLQSSLKPHRGLVLFQGAFLVSAPI